MAVSGLTVLAGYHEEKHHATPAGREYLSSSLWTFQQQHNAVQLGISFGMHTMHFHLNKVENYAFLADR